MRTLSSEGRSSGYLTYLIIHLKKDQTDDWFRPLKVWNRPSIVNISLLTGFIGKERWRPGSLLTWRHGLRNLEKSVREQLQTPDQAFAWPVKVRNNVGNLRAVGRERGHLHRKWGTVKIQNKWHLISLPKWKNKILNDLFYLLGIKILVIIKLRLQMERLVCPLCWLLGLLKANRERESKRSEVIWPESLWGLLEVCLMKQPIQEPQTAMAITVHLDCGQG